MKPETQAEDEDEDVAKKEALTVESKAVAASDEKREN